MALTVRDMADGDTEWATALLLAWDPALPPEVRGARPGAGPRGGWRALNSSMGHVKVSGDRRLIRKVNGR